MSTIHMFKLRHDVDPQYLTMAVFSAVRGPDMPSSRDGRNHHYSEIKDLVTARIRSLLFAGHVADWGSWTREPFSAHECELLKDAIAHIHAPVDDPYIDHLRDAVAATSSAPVWGGFASQITNTLWGH